MGAIGQAVPPADLDAARRPTIEELANNATSAAIRYASKVLLANAETSDQGFPVPAERQDWTGRKEPVKKAEEAKNPLLIGQGLNPCYPCRSCCRGKFKLRTGCYVISGLLCAGSVLHIVSTFGVFPGLKSWSINAHDNFTVDAAELYDYAENFAVFSTMTLTDSLGFVMIPGILILVGTFLLHCPTLLAYTVLMTAGSVFTVVEAGIFSWLVLSAKVKDLHAQSSRHALVGFTWMLLMIAVGIKVYFIMCGFALYLQIRDDEYFRMKIQPQKISQTSVRSGASSVRDQQVRASNDVAGISSEHKASTGSGVPVSRTVSAPATVPI